MREGADDARDAMDAERDRERRVAAVEEGNRRLRRLLRRRSAG
jgi:hypothetical protein